MITTADGRDLNELLVAAGFARIYGTRTPLPDGRDSRTYLAHLALLESGPSVSALVGGASQRSCPPVNDQVLTVWQNEAARACIRTTAPNLTATRFATMSGAMFSNSMIHSGRSLLQVTALATLAVLSLGLSSAKAEVTRKWAFEVPPVNAAAEDAGVQLWSDGAGGVVALCYQRTEAGNVRKLIWLDDQGKLLVNVTVGQYAEIAAAFKKVCYLVAEVVEEGEESFPAVRVVTRKGTVDLTKGSMWISDELGNLGDTTISKPFAGDGFFAFESYIDENNPEYSVRLRIVHYAVRD